MLFASAPDRASRRLGARRAIERTHPGDNIHLCVLPTLASRRPPRAVVTALPNTRFGRKVTNSGYNRDQH